MLIHPQWLEGCPKHDEQGREYGGSATDSVEATIRWNNARAAKLRLLEVRGSLPEQVTCPENGRDFFHRWTWRNSSQEIYIRLRCRWLTERRVCPLSSPLGKVGRLLHTPFKATVEKRKESGQPYGGRFFASPPEARRYNTALEEWACRKDGDLGAYWPKSELPYGFMTHMNNGGLPNHGFTHWWKMFTPLQLLFIPNF